MIDKRKLPCLLITVLSLSLMGCDGISSITGKAESIKEKITGEEVATGDTEVNDSFSVEIVEETETEEAATYFYNDMWGAAEKDFIPWKDGYGINLDPYVFSDVNSPIDNENVEVVGYRMENGERIRDVSDIYSVIDDHEDYYIIKKSQDDKNGYILLEKTTGICSGASIKGAYSYSYAINYYYAVDELKCYQYLKSKGYDINNINDINAGIDELKQYVSDWNNYRSNDTSELLNAEYIETIENET